MHTVTASSCAWLRFIAVEEGISYIAGFRMHGVQVGEVRVFVIVTVYQYLGS